MNDNMAQKVPIDPGRKESEVRKFSVLGTRVRPTIDPSTQRSNGRSWAIAIGFTSVVYAGYLGLSDLVQAQIAIPVESELNGFNNDCLTPELLEQLDRPSPPLTRENYQNAIACYQHQLELARETGDEILESTALQNLGETYQTLGDYTRAIESYQQQWELAASRGDLERQSQAYSGLGSVYAAIDDFDLSLSYYQSSLKLARTVGNSQTATHLLRTLGSIYHAQQSFDRAIEAYQQSLTLAQQLGDQLAQAQTLTHLGLAYYDLTDDDRALDYQQRSLTLVQQLDDTGDDRLSRRQAQAQALNHLGLIYRTRQEFEPSILAHQESREIARELGDRRTEATALTLLGETLYQAGQTQDSNATLFQALDLWESLPQDIPSGARPPVSLPTSRQTTYSTLHENLIEQGEFEKALEVAERGRSQIFVELLSKRLSPGKSTPITNPTISEIQHLAQTTQSTIVVYYIGQQVVETEGTRQLQDRELSIWAIDPTGQLTFRQVDLAGISLKALVTTSRELLGVRGIGVVPQVFVSGMLVQLTTDAPESEPWEVLSVDANTETLTLKLPSWNDAVPPIERPFADVATTVESDKTIDPRLQQLYQLLIDPIADLLPTDANSHIAFIPHRELFLVPFAALQDANGQYLIENHTVLSSPSIQILAATQNTRGTPLPQNALIVGNPTMPNIGNPPQPLPTLPSAEREAVKIAEMLQTQALTGNSATETAIRQQLPSANLIHLATHGVFDNRRGIGSAIALTPTELDDGWLSAEELFDLNLNAELAVLSACNTGQGKLTGYGVIGLSQSLISAGVPSVIVSLWAVPDAPTADLMVEFYQNWQQNPDKAQALRSAMLATMKQHPHPRNWAAFTLIGNSQ